MSFTNPDGTKPPGCPAWWPFGTLTQPAGSAPPVIRTAQPRTPIAELPPALF